MSAERMARLVLRWVRFYTRGLPGPIAERRIAEIEADLHDQIAHERAEGAASPLTALSIAARMVRGLAADATWRRQNIARPPTKEPPRMSPARRSATRVALVTALVLLVPLVAMQLSEDVSWSLADFAAAAVLLAGAGILLEVAVRNPFSVAYRTAAIAVAVGAIVFGEADDAPGLVLFGCLLMLGTVALAFRTAQGSE